MGEGRISYRPWEELPLSIKLIGLYHLVGGALTLIIAMIVSFFALNVVENFAKSGKEFIYFLTPILAVFGVSGIVLGTELLNRKKFAWYIIFVFTVLSLPSLFFPVALLILWKLYDHRGLFSQEGKIL